MKPRPEWIEFSARRPVRRLAAAAVLALAVTAGIATAGPMLVGALSSPPEFDHALHSGLFPSCQSCHAGVLESDAALWPDAASCAACHDGVVEDRVEWSPPDQPPATNLAFDHFDHMDTVSDSAWAPVACGECHNESGASRMSVELAVTDRCLECHAVEAEHLAAPSDACLTCHLTLPEAERLTEDRIAAFEAPPSHDEAPFALTGHGETATDATCAVCHAREFCTQCHVDAPEQPSIQALAPDPRSLAIGVSLAAAPGHDDRFFLSLHGEQARQSPAQCATCHLRESCLTCHVATGSVAEDLYAAGPGRGAGAQTVRHPPVSHDAYFRFAHGDVASADPASCAGCHAREDCLECHRPDPAAGTPGYHTADWLSRHAVGSYSRQTSCSDCHNPLGFCATCHASAGIVARTGTLPDAGYHDAEANFSLGHGQAARQSLESCVSCHAERDCEVCHSAVRGRGINPHGPGFDAERLRESAPSMCTACHGANIPAG